ncbi:MAG: hypothetical protein HOO06_12525 [Bdellovibrionaceae bacterium]|nr:hypothetical protein [Pseudobdellovibrionaceae bacterium]
MKKTILIIFCALNLNSFVLAANNNCPDNALLNLNWSVEKRESVTDLAYELERQVDVHPKNFKEKKVFKMYSSIAKRWVELTSVDSIVTPENEMMGDILWIRDLETKEAAEVRWYAHGKIFVIYNSSFQSCATNLVPYVDNSLY